MEMNQFKVFSSWDPRDETAESLGRRMLLTIDSLSRLGPLFRDWWFLDCSRPTMEMNMENYHDYLLPLSEVRNRMTEIVEQGVRRGDYREPEPAGGYSIDALNTFDQSYRTVSLSAHGAGVVDPRAGLRYANFETAGNQGIDPDIIAYPVFKSILTTIVSAWDVGYAQAYSTDLSKLWHKPHKYDLDLAWMTYLSPQLAKNFVSPRNVNVERTDDDGVLLIAAEETFDAANLKHLEAAQDIVRALRQINTDMERRNELLWPSRPPRSLQ
jgi:hypothetical protein